MAKSANKSAAKSAAADPSGVDLLRGYVQTQCAAILDAEAELVKAPQAQSRRSAIEESDVVELVHDTRVAIRRLRSTLRTFASAFDETERRRLITETGWYAETLGKLRDLDVIGERATAGLAALPDALRIDTAERWLDADLTERRAAHQGVVAAVIASDRYAALRELLQRWRADPNWSETADQLRITKRVKKAKKRVTRRIAEALEAYHDDAPDLAELMHRARKAGKRHRYAVEAAAPLLDGKAEAIIGRRKALQDQLGSIQDGAVTEAYLTELGTRIGRQSGRNAFTLGALAAREQQLQDRIRAEFADSRS